MEWAFRGPARLKERLGGTLDAAAIAAMPVDDVVAVFSAKPALHRFPGVDGQADARALQPPRRRVRRRHRRRVDRRGDGRRAARAPALGLPGFGAGEGQDLRGAARQAHRRATAGLGGGGAARSPTPRHARSPTSTRPRPSPGSASGRRPRRRRASPSRTEADRGIRPVLSLSGAREYRPISRQWSILSAHSGPSRTARDRGSSSEVSSGMSGARDGDDPPLGASRAAAGTPAITDIR